MSYENTDLETTQSSTEPEVIEKKNDVLIIKGKFKFQSSGIFGMFAILMRSDTESADFYDDASNPFLSLNIIVSYFSDVFQTDLKESWDILEEKFNEIEISNDYATSMTNNFRRGFINSLSNEEIGLEIISDFKKNNIHSIEREIDRILTQAHKDIKVDFELFFEEADGRNIASVRKLRMDSESPLPNDDILTTPSARANPTEFYIPATPILSPLGEGVPSNQLSPGVRILMKVNTSTSYGRHWAEHFKLYDKDTKTYLPIVGTIDQVGPVIKNCLDIVVKYQHDQHTKFNIESGIKLKLFNPHSSDSYIDPLVYRRDNSQKETKTMSQLLEEEGFRSLLAVGVCALVLAMLSLYFIN